MITKQTAIIVDDEAPARQRLHRLLESSVNDIEIIGQAENGIQAIELINNLKPDVVFLDIQMPGYDGFEVIEYLNVIPQIIFCTAYEEYAVKAFDVNGVDYLVKPIMEERLCIAIKKLKKMHEDVSKPEDVIEVVKQMLQMRQEPELTSLPVKLGDRVVFVALNDIMMFEAKDKYVSIFTRKGKEYIIDLSLNQLIQRLPKYFMRVHRAIIINQNNIQEIRKYLNSRYVLLMNEEQRTRVTTGRSYSDLIKNLLKV